MARRKRRVVLGGPFGQFNDIRMGPEQSYATIQISTSGMLSAKKQTIDQTISPSPTDDCWTKSDRQKKPWTELATDLKKRWFAEMKKRKRWIPRKQFLTDFLNGNEGSRDKWKDLKVSTEDRRFGDNKDRWETEADALKSSLNNRR